LCHTLLPVLKNCGAAKIKRSLGFEAVSLGAKFPEILHACHSRKRRVVKCKLGYICLMEVNDAMVDKLAHLARLKFNEADKQEIKTDLQRMIAFVEKLNELDLSGVEPLMHMSDEVNVLREDEIKGSVSREEALKNAPLHDGQFFKVPKVINK
jgi:aspartyl-tRNA(Asn)/glutamyl-tRNA(Gln) amidotransferase subunit C